jgi:cyclic beta-1,2-glucan synthetase
MGTLARFRGHFYNWYDTTDLRPLDPQYVSTVDSGNLAGHLIALANACDSWSDLSLSADKRLEGIRDALDLVREEVDNLRDSRRTETVTWRQFDEALAMAGSQVRSSVLTPETIAERLARLTTIAETLADITQAFAIERGEASTRSSVLGGGRPQANSHHRDVTSGPAEIRSRLSAIGEIAGNGAVDGVRLPAQYGTNAAFIGSWVRRALDESCYDLWLRSQACELRGHRQGRSSSRHWFRLAHDVTPVGADTAYFRSGSMFGIHASLVMRAPTMSVLEQTNRIVRRQIEYGASPTRGEFRVRLQRP